AQHDGGGWRYAPRQVGDTSVTTWQVLALTQGKRAGLHVPAEAFQKATKYLDSATLDEGARYAYVPSGPPSPTMTAAALLCRHALGWESRHPAMLKGA